LAQIVKDKREKLSLSQEQLGNKTKINRTMIGRIERKDYIPTVPQLQALAETLQFEVDTLFIENKPAVFTAFRGDNLTAEEQAGVNHLFDMMVAAKQQLMLREALKDDKRD
ncbi:MAG TPA: helix-turn-helix transcriptional regulator, partial [Lachnospiraceae bacterium]|nr:helix-turn-helix transcriptional regulator [Lachnospiraceae bacterium]